MNACFVFLDLQTGYKQNTTQNNTSDDLKRKMKKGVKAEKKVIFRDKFLQNLRYNKR